MSASEIHVAVCLSGFVCVVYLVYTENNARFKKAKKRFGCLFSYFFGNVRFDEVACVNIPELETYLLASNDRKVG